MEDNKTLTAFALLLSLGFFAMVISREVGVDGASAPSRTVRTIENIDVEAKSAYIYDIRTERVIFAKDGERPMPLASLSKLMSALVAEDIYYDYGTVTISLEALSSLGDSGLKLGERWRLRDLLDFSLITSSNDGIRAVALTLGGTDFIEAMNRKAHELNLRDTSFQNETGLDESDTIAGNYGSAKDVSLLMRHLMEKYPESLEATKIDVARLVSFDGNSYLAKNTNNLIDEIPGLLASKTGYTDVAGGNLAFVFDPELGRPIVVVILGSSAEGRFEDARKLLQATMKYIQ